MKRTKQKFKKTSCNSIYMSVVKANMNVSLYKKPAQSNLELKFTFESKQPGPCVDVTHLYR